MYAYYLLHGRMHSVCSYPDRKGTRLCSHSCYTIVRVTGRAEDPEAGEDGQPQPGEELRERSAPLNLGRASHRDRPLARLAAQGLWPKPASLSPEWPLQGPQHSLAVSVLRLSENDIANMPKSCQPTIK